MKNKFVGELVRLLIFEFCFTALLFVALSVLRYFNPTLVGEIIEVFDEYINTEISLSLVLDGK